MSENQIFENNFRDDSAILEGKILIHNIEKDDSKIIYEKIINGLDEYPQYEDYLLNGLNVDNIDVASFGYLMKALSKVKKTSGYMILIMKDEMIQKFMISNPEMFDYFVIFSNLDEAIEYILLKRK